MNSTRRTFVIRCISACSAMCLSTYQTCHARFWSGLKKAFTKGAKAVFGGLAKGVKKLVKWTGNIAKGVVKAATTALAPIIELAMRHLLPDAWYFSKPVIAFRVGLDQYDARDVVYFINGVNTSRKLLKQHATVLSAVLRRPVFAIHNPTRGLFLDFMESIFDAVWTPPMLAPNRTTKQVAWLIRKSKKPLSIVTHSQGCLITLNAALIVAAYGYRTRLRKVRWVATGWDVDALNARGTTNLMNRFTQIASRRDWLVRFSQFPAESLMAIPTTSIESHSFSYWENQASSSVFHERTNSRPDVTRGYASLVRNSQLWPLADRNQHTSSLGSRERTIEVQNLSSKPAEVTYQKLFRQPRTKKVFVDSHFRQRSQVVPPRTSAVLRSNTGEGVFQAELVELMVKVENTVELHGSVKKPLFIGADSYEGDTHAFQIEVSDESTYNFAPFATSVINGRETLWLGVQNDRAFTLDESGQSGAFLQTDDPIGGHPNEFCYRDTLKPNEGVVYVPKSGAGAVTRRYSNGAIITICELRPFDPDAWPGNWKPIELPGDVVPSEKQERAQFILGVTSIDDWRGTKIAEVFPNSPAQMAGLEVGDVIVAANGIAVTSARHSEHLVRHLQGQDVQLRLLGTVNGYINLESLTPKLGVYMRPGTMIIDRITEHSVCNNMVDDLDNPIELQAGDEIMAIEDHYLDGRVDLRIILKELAGQRVRLKFLSPGSRTRIVRAQLNRLRRQGEFIQIP